MATPLKQRDDAAVQITELEAALENMDTDGSLRNGFVSAFGKYLEVEEITDEDCGGCFERGPHPPWWAN